jgi:hypothetical protein
MPAQPAPPPACVSALDVDSGGFPGAKVGQVAVQMQSARVESKVGSLEADADEDRPAAVSERVNGTDSEQRAEPEAEAVGRG